MGRERELKLDHRKHEYYLKEDKQSVIPFSRKFKKLLLKLNLQGRIAGNEIVIVDSFNYIVKTKHHDEVLWNSSTIDKSESLILENLQLPSDIIDDWKKDGSSDNVDNENGSGDNDGSGDKNDNENGSGDNYGSGDNIDDDINSTTPSDITGIPDRPAFQFWNNWTITLVAVGSFILVSVMIIIAYYIGKRRGQDDNDVAIESLEPQRTLRIPLLQEATMKCRKHANPHTSESIRVLLPYIGYSCHISDHTSDPFYQSAGSSKICEPLCCQYVTQLVEQFYGHTDLLTLVNNHILLLPCLLAVSITGSTNDYSSQGRSGGGYGLLRPYPSYSGGYNGGYNGYSGGYGGYGSGYGGYNPGYGGSGIGYPGQGYPGNYPGKS
ncbi:hypothetical protein RR48_01344 [Papilio machaon]|uniref:Uncharacterized protein n=1 Tax=Papilio machaon TaxID=76193 RepID=A0A0N1IH96_PAPMA|nr:hypothetical protein RR48_01344 [Papilio machaon]